MARGAPTEAMQVEENDGTIEQILVSELRQMSIKEGFISDHVVNLSWMM
jgi:hypothetical protein